MTNPTPHGQAPAIQRYKIGYHSDEWGARSSTPGGICDDAGPWVRYEDHAAMITALRTYCQELEAHVILDCMTHVQNPAEIEHVAGDVSKNGEEVNMMGLIDTYAETRHRCGGIYNAKTETARKAVIEALSGVQALSAAPAVEVENLRKALVYVAFALHSTPQYMLAQGITLIDGDTVRVSRDGWTVEASANPLHQPPKSQAVESVPVLPDFDTVEQYIYGACRRYITRDMLEPIHNLIRDAIDSDRAASPTPPAEKPQPHYSRLHDADAVHGKQLSVYSKPPAEQQAQSGAVYAELPQPDSWFHFTAQFWENKLRDFADRTHALRMEQAAPKEAPGEQFDSEGFRAWVLRNLPDETIIGSSAWWADHLTTWAQRFMTAAPKQEAQEPVAWESTTPGYIKYITQARYEKFSPAVRRWYKPYRCSGCAERGAGFDACDIATAAAQGFRDGQSTTKQEE